MKRTRRTVRLRITLEARVVGWLRTTARKREVTVSQLVGDILRDEKQRDDAYEAARQERLAIIKPVMFEKPGGRFPTRDELHDRPKRRS